MRASAPVVVYETKPATEWLLGGPVQKVSPRNAHAVLQGTLFARLHAWARGRGRVGIEWRFWLQPPDEEARYLVPDVAHLSYDRLPREARSEAEEPRMAPDVACEILSPDDRPEIVAHKIDVYLSSGTSLVAVVDPACRTFRAIDGSGEKVYAAGDTFVHPALPEFALDLADFFAELDV